MKKFCHKSLKTFLTTELQITAFLKRTFRIVKHYALIVFLSRVAGMTTDTNLMKQEVADLKSLLEKAHEELGKTVTDLSKETDLQRAALEEKVQEVRRTSCHIRRRNGRSKQYKYQRLMTRKNSLRTERIYNIALYLVFSCKNHKAVSGS